MGVVRVDLVQMNVKKIKTEKENETDLEGFLTVEIIVEEAILQVHQRK